MKTIHELRIVYRLYRSGGHSITYAARQAWNIAVRGFSF
jgi:hypothetical protein